MRSKLRGVLTVTVSLIRRTFSLHAKNNVPTENLGPDLDRDDGSISVGWDAQVQLALGRY